MTARVIAPRAALIALAPLIAILITGCGRDGADESLRIAREYVAANDAHIKPAIVRWLMNRHPALYDVGEPALLRALNDSLTYDYEHPHYAGYKWIAKPNARIDIIISLLNDGQGRISAMLPIWTHVHNSSGDILLAEPKYRLARSYAEIPALTNQLPIPSQGGLP